MGMGGRQQGNEPTGGDEGVCAAGDGDSIGKADGGFMSPVELSSAPGEGLSSLFVIPQVGKVPLGALIKVQSLSGGVIWPQKKPHPARN